MKIRKREIRRMYNKMMTAFFWKAFIVLAVALIMCLPVLVHAQDDSQGPVAAKESLLQLSVKLKASELAAQVGSYLQEHPEKTIAALQNDSFFRSLAVQKVGATGYTALVDSSSGIIYFHPQKSLINTDSHQLSASLPTFWAIFEKALGPVCRESSGFYDWKEADGSISQKYMYLACVDKKTADGRPLLVAATTYLDDMNASHYLSAYKVGEFSTFAQESIRQKAVDVAKQLEIYIKARPGMTVAELQNDSYFSEIAVQLVGKTGYTAVADTDTLINRFHQNPKIANLDLSTLADKLPGFWKVMSKTKGGLEAEGVYDWAEADGRITQKYMYIAVVNALTADGVRFNVAATTYLSEYASAEKPVAANLSAASSSTILFNLNFTYVIIGVIGTIICFFLIVSISKDSEKDVRMYFISYILSAILLAVSYVVRLHVQDPVILGFMLRLVVFSVGCFLFYYFLSVVSVARVKINLTILLLLHLINFTIMILTMFTNLIIGGVVYDSEIMQKYGIVNLVQGPLFSVFIILAILYFVSTLALLFSICIKKRDFKLLALFSAFMAAFLGLGIYSWLSEFWNPLILLILPFAVASVYAALLFKQGFLRIKRDMALFVIVVFILVLIGLFVFNTFIVSERIYEGTRKVSDEAQAVIIKQDAAVLQNSMNNLVNSVSFFAKNKMILSGNASSRRSVINDLNEYIYYSYGNNYVMLFDYDKRIVDQSSTLFSIGNGNADLPALANSANYDDYSGFLNEVSMNMAYVHRQVAISYVFKGRDSRDMISLFTPVYENAEFKGMLVVSFGAVEMLALVENPNDQNSNRNVYLLIGDAIIGTSGPRLEDLVQSNSTFDNMKKKIRAGNGGLFENTFVNASESKWRVVPLQKFILFYEPVRVLDGYWGVITVNSRVAIDDILSESINKLWVITLSTIVFILLGGVLFGFMIMRDLRHKVDEKTNEIIAINANLEEKIQERTSELEKLNKELESRVDARAKELNDKVAELQDARIAILNMLEDVSLSKDEIEKSKEELVRINKKMKKANEELKKADYYKNQFISITAHELKTPLASIHGFANLLQNKKIVANIKQRDNYLSIIMQDSDRLKRLIEDILDLSRLDIGTLKFVFEKVDVKDIFKEVMKEMYVLASKNSLSLKVSVASDVPAIITDKSRLSQVLVNLTSNSVKYNITKGGKIIVKAEKHGKSVLFLVKDTGIGIPRKNQPKIFQRFYQAESWLTRKVGGSGLGLSICKGIVEALGGKIWFKSEEGKGSTFFFTLPIKSDVALDKEQSLSVVKAPDDDKDKENKNLDTAQIKNGESGWNKVVTDDRVEEKAANKDNPNDKVSKDHKKRRATK
ncbi:MAG: ATP-binding protein [archaeon]